MVSRTNNGFFATVLLNLGILAVGAVPSVPHADLDRAAIQANLYPTRAWACVGGFIAFVSLCHIISLFGLVGRRAPPYDSVSRNRGIIQLGRLPAAFMHTFRVVAFRWTLSLGGSYNLNVAEVFMSAGYIAILFAWSFANSTSSLGSIANPHIYADTAGHIAASQISLTAALGMKNNIICFLTGISVNRINFLHRMTARVLVVLIWVHASGRLEIGIIPVQWSQPWFRCGFIAATSLSLLALISLRPVRNRTYEVFLGVHFVLSWLFVGSAYYHARNDGYGNYVWPALVLMGLDRVLRVLRLVVYNFGYIVGRRPTGLDARVDILSPDFLRISLDRPQHVNWTPGQSAYISMPGIAPLQFHPFTISTIDVRGMPLEKYATESQTKLDYSGVKDVQKLAFLVRVRKGFTATLLRNAQDNKLLKVFFDGPYGSPPVLKGYGTVILIAGGSGVSFTLPLLLDLVHRAAGNEATCHKVVFVWVFRDASQLKWMSDALVPVMHNLRSTITVEIRLFTTAAAVEKDPFSLDSPIEDKSLSLPIAQGRPDIRSLINNEIANATGDIAVNVCGTGGLAKSVKGALRNPRFMDILRGGPSVTLHLEAFGI